MQFLMVAACGKLQGVEVGVEMAAHPVGADQHERPHAVAGRLQDLGLRDLDALGLGFRLTLPPTAPSIGAELPSSAATSSPFAAIGQFGRVHEAPSAFFVTIWSSSLRTLKNACHSASTEFESLVYWA